jgi:uncharacterized membrane protein
MSSVISIGRVPSAFVYVCLATCMSLGYAYIAVEGSSVARNNAATTVGLIVSIGLALFEAWREYGRQPHKYHVRKAAVNALLYGFLVYFLMGATVSILSFLLFPIPF